MRALLRVFGLVSQDDEPGAPAGRPAVDTESVIGPGITLKGEIKGEGKLTVLGSFEGDITLDGVVHVGPQGRLDANIAATKIVVGGVVRGNLSADTRVEILPTGSLTGTVKSGSFSAAQGASVKGEVWVDRPRSEPDAAR